MSAELLPEDCLDELERCSCDGCVFGAGPCRDLEALTCSICGFRIDPIFYRQYRARELREVCRIIEAA